MESEDKGRIDKVREGIYNRDFKSEPFPVHQNYGEHPVEVNKGWRHDETTSNVPEYAPPQIVAGGFFKKILIASIIFFALSAAALAYMFLGGLNIVTANKLDITFLGPVTIAAGTELDFDVVVENQNHADIENTVMYIDYPEGTKQADLSADLLHDKKSLGTIKPGGTARQPSSSVHFGELNSERQIKVTVEYNVKNSKSVFRKEKIYTVTISSTPITLDVGHPNEAVTNDEVEYVVAITSNSPVPLTHLLLRAEYPAFGFSFTSADPKPTYDTNAWYIDTLKPGETKVVTVRGRVQGEEGDERVVRFALGAQSGENDKLIGTVYLNEVESVFLKKPPLAMVLDLDGSTLPTFTTEQGSVIRGTFNVTNNLSVRVVNTEIKLTFNGKLFDPRSVNVSSGYYRSVDNQIIWDKKTFSNLESIEPGQTIRLPFSFSTVPASVSSGKNNTMTLTAALNANRTTDDSSGTVSAGLTRTVITKTSLGLVTRSVYSIGPFRNRGPVPPKANSKTTYTIIWSATNSLNDARGVEVHAQLPVYMKWLGVTNPGSEVVTWNADQNEVVWRIGDLAAGAGSPQKPAREVAFQVELTPSINQVSETPELVGAATMTGTDSFTNAVLSVTGAASTIRLSTDPKYSGEEAVVTR